MKATRTTGQVNASYGSFFHLILKKMFIDGSDVRKIIAEVQTTNWRLRQCIWVRELTATHQLGQMRRLRMLEEQKAWKREAGFEYIDTAAEMDAQRFRTNVVSETSYSKMSTPRWPHTPDELRLEMRVDVERLRMEIVLSQSAPPPQCVIHRRYGYPWSIQGRRNPERRDGRPQSVRGHMNSEYRELRLSRRRGKELFLFKPAWMVFCASTAQARIRTSGRQ